MIDDVIDAFGWDRKHAIKALNGKVALGKKARIQDEAWGRRARDHRRNLEVERTALWRAFEGKVATLAEQLRAKADTPETLWVERLPVPSIPFPPVRADSSGATRERSSSRDQDLH